MCFSGSLMNCGGSEEQNSQSEALGWGAAAVYARDL